MGMRDAQVSDEERNEMVRPHTRVEMADAEASVAAARAHVDPVDDDDRMYMDVDAIPPPSPTRAAGVGTSSAADPVPETGPSHAAGPSRPPADDVLSLFHEIREAAAHRIPRIGELLRRPVRTDQRVADLTASLRATRTRVAWLTRVYAKDYDERP
ncbi:hypothetical protein NE237_015342 [Protea cynaroides]|uniref:Uncharacterized protein n=1 Tax=Protea cynaroides TaxID=273540 RepID=A0A9Q0KE38_9MAGN|nr:hypothetical protein NE237_015342 [Protea cynaroides]